MKNKLNPKVLKKFLFLIYQDFIHVFETSIDDDLKALSTQEQFGLDLDDMTQYLAASLGAKSSLSIKILKT